MDEGRVVEGYTLATQSYLLYAVTKTIELS